MRSVGRGSCAQFYPSLVPTASTIRGRRKTPSVDLLLSQRGRKGFVGGKGNAAQIADSLSLPTGSAPGGGRFDLTYSFHTLGFIGRIVPACQACARVLAGAPDSSQTVAPKREEAERWPMNPLD